MSESARGSWTTTKPSMPCGWPSNMTWVAKGFLKSLLSGEPSTGSRLCPCPCMALGTAGPAPTPSAAAGSGPLHRSRGRRPATLSSPGSLVTPAQLACSAALHPLSTLAFPPRGSATTTQAQRRIAPCPVLPIAPVGPPTPGCEVPASRDTRAACKTPSLGRSPGSWAIARAGDTSSASPSTDLQGWGGETVLGR